MRHRPPVLPGKRQTRKSLRMDDCPVCCCCDRKLWRFWSPRTYWNMNETWRDFDNAKLCVQVDWAHLPSLIELISFARIAMHVDLCKLTQASWMDHIITQMRGNPADESRCLVGVLQLCLTVTTWPLLFGSLQLQCGPPQMAKLVYNSNNDGLWMFMVLITLVSGIDKPNYN